MKLITKKKFQFNLRLFKKNINKAIRNIKSIKTKKYHYEISENFDREKNTIVFWNVKKSEINFFKRFFEEDQIIFAKSVQEFKKFAQTNQLDFQRVSFYVLYKSNRFKKFAEKNSIPIIFLRKGLIGHPFHPNLTASFLESFSSRKVDKFNAEIFLTKLQNSEISKNESLLKKAAELRHIYKTLGIGYDNRAGILDTKKILGPKINKRVLILVSQSHRYLKLNLLLRSPDRIESLLKLAISENPNADIYLYDKNSNDYELKQEIIKVDNKDCLYSIIPNTITTTAIIKECDHIYTHQELAAFDAIVYEKKLTVTGAPFYCGWGLTDDRNKKLNLSTRHVVTIDEFFGMIFLENTRYSYNNAGSVTGLLSSLFEVYGARYEQTLLNVNRSLSNSKTLSRLAESEYWPALFHILRNEKLTNTQISVLTNCLGMSSRHPFGKKCNYAIAAALIGLTINKPHFKTGMAILKKKVPSEDIVPIFQLIIELMPPQKGLKEVETILEAEKNWDKCYQILCLLLHKYPSNTYNNEASTDNKISVEGKEGDYQTYNKFVSEESFDVEYKAALVLKEMKMFEASEKAFYKILLSGIIKKEIFVQLAELAFISFQFEDSVNLNHIAILLNTKKPHGPLQKQSLASYILGDADYYLKSLLASLYLSPSLAVQHGLNKDLLESKFGSNLPYEAGFLNISNKRLNKNPRSENDIIALANTYLVCGEFKKQLELLHKITIPIDKKEYYLALMNGYLFMGDYEKSKQIIEELFIHYPALNIYQAAAKLAIRMGDCEWADQIFKNAITNNIKKNGVIIDEISFRKFNLIKQNIKEAYSSYRSIAACKNLTYYFKDKYIQSSINNQKRSLLILAFFGPGDEIRFASLYNEMHNLFSNTQIAFTCEPRLYDLFKNSFPEFNFIPVARQRKLSFKLNLSNYSQLPSSQLHDLFDNNGWELAQKYEAVTLVTDLLGDIIQGKHSLKGKSYLKPIDSIKQYWEKRIKSDRIKIGLSWRSSLVTYARSEHYLSIEDMKPLIDAFKEKVEFFNLQYDYAKEELNWVKDNSNVELTNFDDLDQYNDLSSVAGLMSCMDLIISPATTVVELAGALGCPTLLISNSPELHWRKVDALTKVDVWHRSVIHVEGETLGDKESVVANLINSVSVFLTERDTQNESGYCSRDLIDKTGEKAIL